MGKITKAENKKHEEVLKLLDLKRDLTFDETEFVYTHFNPMATNNVGKNAIFFTPPDLAWELAINSDGTGNVIDLAAGIGVLSWAHRRHSDAPKIKRHVAIEINPEFVEFGKKLLPDVEWYCGSIFDLELLRKIGPDFNVAISNPPFGHIASMTETEWMKTKGPAEVLAIEIALRMAYCGGIFILPEKYSDIIERDVISHWTDEEGNHWRGVQHDVHTHQDPCREIENLRKRFGNVWMAPWFSAVYDEVEWQCKVPDVLILDVNCDEVTWARPFGLPEIVKQEVLL